MIYGYAPVSTDGRSVAAQVETLTAAGVGRALRETAGGAKPNRHQLPRAVAALVEGDQPMVTRVDRLARSTRDLLNTLAMIAGCKAGFRYLADALAVTTTPHGRLMLTVLGGVGEFERDRIRARTADGRAKASGVKLGRMFRLTHFQRREAASRKVNGEPVRVIAWSYNASAATILRLVG